MPGEPSIRFLADIPAAHARGRGRHVALTCEGRTLKFAHTGASRAQYGARNASSSRRCSATASSSW